MERPRRLGLLAAAAIVAGGLSGATARAEAAEGVVNIKCNTREVADGISYDTVIYYSGKEGGEGEKLKVEMVKVTDGKKTGQINHTIATEGSMYNWEKGNDFVSVKPLDVRFRQPSSLRRYLDSLSQKAVESSQPFVCADISAAEIPDGKFVPPPPRAPKERRFGS